jgi:hypothetical protein
MTLKAIIDEIANARADIKALARAQMVDPAEVADALAKAKSGTVEHVVLSVLAEAHPAKAPAAPPPTEE